MQDEVDRMTTPPTTEATPRKFSPEEQARFEWEMFGSTFYEDALACESKPWYTRLPNRLNNVKPFLQIQWQRIQHFVGRSG